MKTALRALIGMTLGISSMGLLAGCEVSDCDDGATAEGEQAASDGTCTQFKSLKRFDGTQFDLSSPWASGQGVRIASVLGKVNVHRGDAADSVSVHVAPFVSRAYDTPKEEAAVDIEKLQATVTDSDGTILVETARPGDAPDTLGADLNVYLPLDFDGPFTLLSGAGQTRLDYVGTSASVTVKSKTGDCLVSDTGAAESLEVRCETGDIEALMTSAPPGTGLRQLITEFGDITADFSPVIDLPFTVVAQTVDNGELDEDGTVTIASLSAGCVVTEDNTYRKTIVCNGATDADPVYGISADGVFPEVTLTL